MRHPASDRQGQVTLMIGMMMMTFMLLFAFVVNTGMLVHAKINLQNAADVAAYAGAAVQARQLNQISFLNYEMRRQYKKFLFRYYILGNMAQKSNPTATGSGPRSWKPANKIVDFDVPVVCLIISETDNYCGQDFLPAIAPGKANPADTINTVLEAAIQKIENLRQGQCRAISYKNIQTLVLWLFNTDPELNDLKQRLQNVATGPDTQAVADRLQVMQHISQGLGLIPRELILALRIKTLEKYINEAPKRALTKAAIAPLETTGDIAKNERSIQAFYSAFNSLGEHTFGGVEDITLDELLPTGASGANLIKLNQIKTGFDTYALDLVRGPGFDAGQPHPALPNPPTTQLCTSDTQGGVDQKYHDCVPCAVPISVPKDQLPVGVYKDPSVLTYYAVKLEATAKVMFSPFGDLRLRAYAAAQPFGSRIGPKLTGDEFVRQASNPVFCGGVASGAGVQDCVKAVPNIGILADDTSQTGKGWDRVDIEFSLYQKLLAGIPATESQKRINPDSILRAYEAAMAPNPIEKGKYNIPVYDYAPTGGMTFLPDSFNQYFDEKGIYAFWAPIISSDSGSQTELEDEVRQAFKDMLKTQPGSTEQVLTADFKDALIKSMISYIDKIIQAPGENGEGFHIARIQDPFNHWAAGGPQEAIKLSAPNLLIDPTNPKQVKTSWNGVRDAEWEKQGRVGYSVKFVSFRTLTSPGTAKSDGTQNWSNTGGLGVDLGDDLQSIQH